MRRLPHRAVTAVERLENRSLLSGWDAEPNDWVDTANGSGISFPPGPTMGASVSGSGTLRRGVFSEATYGRRGGDFSDFFYIDNPTSEPARLIINLKTNANDNPYFREATVYKWYRAQDSSYNKGGFNSVNWDPVNGLWKFDSGLAYGRGPWVNPGRNYYSVSLDSIPFGASDAIFDYSINVSIKTSGSYNPPPVTDVVAVEADAEDLDTLVVKYDVAGESLGSAPTVQVYASPTPAFNPATAVPFGSPTTLPEFDQDFRRTWEPGPHTVTVNLGGNIAFDRKTPYLFTVLDPPLGSDSRGRVREIDESNNASRVGLITKDQLKAAMSGLKDSLAAQYVGPLNDAMGEFGIFTMERQGAFLGQLAEESQSLQRWEERVSKPGVMWKLNSSRPAVDIATLGATEAARKVGYFNYWYGPNALYPSPANILGNTQPNDGYTYRGRGPTMLTGRANYRDAGKDLGLPLLAQPDLVKNDITVGFRVSARFFTTKRLALYKNNGQLNATGQAFATHSSVPLSILSSSMLEIADRVDVNSPQSVADVNDALTYGINGGFTNVEPRWRYYRKALRALGLHGLGID